SMGEHMRKVLGRELSTPAQARYLRRDMINAARDLARRGDAAGFAAKVQGAPPEGSPEHARFIAEVEALRAELADSEPYHPGAAVAVAHGVRRERIACLHLHRALEGDGAAAVRLVTDGVLLAAVRGAGKGG